MRAATREYVLHSCVALRAPFGSGRDARCQPVPSPDVDVARTWDIPSELLAARPVYQRLRFRSLLVRARKWDADRPGRPAPSRKTTHHGLSDRWWARRQPALRDYGATIWVRASCQLSRGIGQSRHRCVMVGCAMPHWRLREPQCGQYGPSGQLSTVNHTSAASSVGNIRKSRSRDRPSRYDFPGPSLIDPVATRLLYCK